MESDRHKQLLDVIRKNLSVDSSLKSQSLGIKLLRGLQHFVSLKFKETQFQAQYEVLLAAALTAEKACAGAGLQLLSQLSSESIMPQEKVCRKGQLLRLLQDRGYSRRNYEVLRYLIDEVSIDTKILVKKTTANTLYVELTDGYSIDVQPLVNCIGEHDDVKVACIDGYVETVSEIHHLLQQLSEASMACILLCRGMSDEVVHTLKVNVDRGSLKVFPCIVPFDIENANVIVDVAVIAGTDVVSSLKGQLISSVSVESLGRLESVTFHKTGIRIKNLDSKRRVALHIENIRRSITEKDESVSLVYEKRLRSLAGKSIEICVPDDVDFLNNSQQFDEAIRIISAVMNNMYDPYGVITACLDSYHSSSMNTVTFTTS